MAADTHATDSLGEVKLLGPTVATVSGSTLADIYPERLGLQEG
jgi:hypothetical protein